MTYDKAYKIAEEEIRNYRKSGNYGNYKYTMDWMSSWYNHETDKNYSFLDDPLEDYESS
jgi:hypothetical protein